MNKVPAPAAEIDLALVISDLSGYTALTETHGALRASEIVERFERLVTESLDPGVELINSIGDDVFCAGPSTLAVVRSAIRLHDAVDREPDFPRIRTGIHRGTIVRRGGKLFGAPINLASRLADRAGGGRMLCTGGIAEAASALSRIQARSLGDLQFKNVRDAVPVFELVRTTVSSGDACVDPVCRMRIAVGSAAASMSFRGREFRFCSAECAKIFSDSPEKFAATSAA